MSLFINNNSGPVYSECTVTILNGQTTVQQPEDITPIQEEKPMEKNNLPFLVPAKLAELGTYSISEFETIYHDAVKGGAPKLAKFLKHYRELEVFDTKDLNKKETFEELKAYFGDELDFGYPNFAAYY